MPFTFVGGISGCFFEPQTEGFVFQNAQECSNAFPEEVAQCQVAYKDAVEDAAQDAPRYQSQYACESDFQEGCERYGSWFIPALAGFFFANALDDDYFKKKKKRYYSKPVYRYRGGLYSSDGAKLAGSFGKPAKVSSSSTKKSGGTIGNVMSRGGFGKSVSSSRGG
ncbi:DUF1190 domain-containing protein [Enterovibrio coralii]|uniref:DUF1190 domain-containing protein n=1 Tax=Enterovibrio coralii TaxID=294935 RepID=UPI001E4AF0CE|nr:DUF1190 domain-containing protein [Enterovibrio coralii]